VLGVRLLAGVALLGVIGTPADVSGVVPAPPPPVTTVPLSTTTSVPPARPTAPPVIASAPPTTTSTTTSTTSTTTTTTTTIPLPAIPAAAWNEFDALVAGRLTGRGDRAASVAMSIHGQLVHAAAFGTRTPDNPTEPVTPVHRFRIASISKVITATVVLQLVDAGVLELDEPVGLRLAGFVGVAPGPGVPEVTVRQLLSHTAGFPSYRRQFFGDDFTSCEQAAGFGLSRPLAHQPGNVHEYSNLNFCLLGLLVADITGRPYEDAVNQLLLEPLGISGMRLVATIDPNPDEVVHASGAQRTYMQSLGGAGAWVATATDLVKILDSLDTDTPGWHPLSPTMSLLMRQALDVSYPEPERRRYGLGIIVWPDGSWGHTGTVENTHTMLVRRTDGVTWCILVSGDVPGDTEDLRLVFDRALDGAGIALT
jgi:D-alanyl-D-alanine carboxypeptidase